MTTDGGMSSAMATLILAGVVEVKNYHFRCQHCRYGRHFGKCKLTMEHQALRHAMHKSGHTLQLMADGTVYRIMDYRPKPMVELEGDNSIPF